MCSDIITQVNDEINNRNCFLLIKCVPRSYLFKLTCNCRRYYVKLEFAHTVNKAGIMLQNC